MTLRLISGFGFSINPALTFNALERLIAFVSHTQLDRGKPTPEERELKKKFAELAGLEIKLADKELELATLKAELKEFESLYNSIVGWRFAELDKIRAQIADIEAKLNPQDQKARYYADECNERASESAQESEFHQITQSKPKFNPSENLKKLYRELARLVHPDLTTDPVDRDRRNQTMSLVNQAYEQSDFDRLQELLDDWNTNPESVSNDGLGAELVKIIRKIARVEDRFIAIDCEIESLLDSELNQMRNRVDEAKGAGQDLLNEIADDIDREVAKAKVDGYDVLALFIGKMQLE